MKELALSLILSLGFSTAHGFTSSLKCSDSDGQWHLDIKSDDTMVVAGGVLDTNTILPIKTMNGVSVPAFERRLEKNSEPEVVRIDATNSTRRARGISRSILVLNDACLSANNEKGNLAVLNSNQPVRLCCVLK